MSWEQRPYSYGNEPQYGGGGLRSWFGGLPPAGKAVKGIILANVAMYLLCLITGGEESPIFSALSMKTLSVLHGQIWRLVTFTYLHDQQNFFHIFVNMFILYMVGVPVERNWGSKRFFFFYTASGFAGVSLYLFLTLVGWLPSAYTLAGQSVQYYLIGASGGVFAVLGACAVLFPIMQVVLFVFPIPIRLFTVISAGMFLLNLINRGANAGGDACHLAGLGFGIAYGYRGHQWGRVFNDWRANAQRRAVDAKRREIVELEATVDQILEKVHRQGIGSLTRREKQILEDASKKQKTGGFR